jgi:4-amino-4-deoxy-L-arabinose transferase-like glycosyltransferase
MNIFVGCLVCLVTYVLGREMFGKAAGTFAGLALAFDVNSVAYANQLLTETLFAFILALGVLYLWKYVSRARWRDAAISGTLLGAGALTRPIGALLFVFLAPVFLAVSLHRRSTRLALRDYAVFSVCTTLLVVAWIGRNYAVAGITDLTSIVAMNAYYHRAAAMLAKKEGIPVEAMRKRMRLAFEREFPPDETSLAQRLKVMKQRARKIIGANVGLYLRTHLDGIARMLGAEDLGIMSSAQGEHHYHGPVPPGLRHPIVRLTKNVTHIFVFVLALIGAGWAYRRRMFVPLLLLVSVIGYFFVLSGPEAYVRFQVPIMPFLCILGGIGAACLWDRFGPYSAWVTCG